GLTAPTAFCFDTDNTLLIAEGGIAGDEPRILSFRPGRPGYTVVYPTGRRIPFSPIHTGFQMYGPIGGIYADHGRIFVTHRDARGRGVITRLGYDGGATTVVADLPAQG